jgi:hypothetical protein
MMIVAGDDNGQPARGAMDARCDDLTNMNPILTDLEN